MGAIAVLTGGPLGVRMRPRRRAASRSIEADDFRRLAFAQPAVHRRVMRQVAPVMTPRHRHRAEPRAAGVARHDGRRARARAQQPGGGRAPRPPRSWPRRSRSSARRSARFVESGIEREQAEQLVALQREALAGAERRTALDALDAADAEDELLERLEELGVPEPWRLAEPLAAAGVDGDWLDRVAERGRARDRRGARLGRRDAGRARASPPSCRSRPSACPSLVGAVKTYAYMDRGELVEVDLHEGLETTLEVLGHKLKHTTIEVVRDYDREPAASSPCAAPSSTRSGRTCSTTRSTRSASSGTITIATRRDGGCAVVDVTDDGPGIPPEIRERVFDPFFTTKDVGHGTGLGLATARRIVVDRHDGSLTVDSEPGRTTFHVWLPLTQPDREAPMTTCTHLDHVHVTELPEAVDGCEDCLAAGDAVAAPAHLPGVRPRRLLRQLAEPARERARRASGAPDHPLARAGRGLVVVLRRRGGDAHPGGPGRDRASRRRRSAERVGVGTALARLAPG